MNTGLSATGSSRRSKPRAISEAELQINNRFSYALARLLQVNDAYGCRVMREAILDEVNGLARFVKGLMRDASKVSDEQSGRKDQVTLRTGEP